MIEAIRFNGEVFNHEDDYDYMDNITKNTIVICDSPHTKRKLYKEIESICEGKCIDSGHDYWVNNEDIIYPKITKRIVEYLPTIRFVVDDEQTITLTIEAPFVYTAKDIMDIWFAATDKKNKISVYPMLIFKGCHDIWDGGLDKVYNYVTQGRYGGYEGYWMDKESLENTNTFGWFDKDNKFTKNLDYLRQ